MKNIDAVDYLKNVLGKWSEFCESHRLLACAIADLLKENDMLKAQLRELQADKGGDE